MEITEQNVSSTKSDFDDMLARLAASDAEFKSQQRGEPELSVEEKTKIASDLFSTKPAVFLSKFGYFLSEEDLLRFDSVKDDYVVDFHLKDIKRHISDKKNKQRVKNRRYEAMQKMLKEGSSYFEDEEMKSRDPLLFEEMIGKYMSEEEIQALVDKADCRMSNILMNHIQILHNNALYDHQVKTEKGIPEDEEFEEEFDSDDEEEAAKNRVKKEEEEDSVDFDPETITDSEKALLRAEFMSTMKARFLDGSDKHYFDYGKVDGNAEFDSIAIRTQDEEEKYFDDEEPSDVIEELGAEVKEVNVNDADQCDVAMADLTPV